MRTHRREHTESNPNLNKGTKRTQIPPSDAFPGLQLEMGNLGIEPINSSSGSVCFSQSYSSVHFGFGLDNYRFRIWFPVFAHNALGLVGYTHTLTSQT